MILKSGHRPFAGHVVACNCLAFAGHLPGSCWQLCLRFAGGDLLMEGVLGSLSQQEKNISGTVQSNGTHGITNDLRVRLYVYLGSSNG